MQSTRGLPQDQEWIIQVMKDYGYSLKEDGDISFGIACMGMQAVHAHAVDQFNECLQRIYDLYELKHIHHFNPIFHTDTKEEIEQEEIPTDLKDFLKGILRYQEVAASSKPRNEKQKNYTQDTLRNMPLIVPVESENTAETLLKLETFSGCYSETELQTYFYNIRFAFQEQNEIVSLVLCSTNRSMKISYDPEAKHWICIDGDRLPVKIIGSQDISELSGWVSDGLSMDSPAIFSTHINTPHHNEAAARQCLQACQENPYWQEIHKITQAKAGLTDACGYSWLFHATDEGYVETAELLLNAGADPYYEENYSADHPVSIAARNCNQDMIMMFADHGCNLSSVSQLLLVQEQKLHMIAILLKCGATTRYIDKIIAAANRPEKVKTVLDNAVKINEIYRELEFKAEPYSVRLKAIKQLKRNILQCEEPSQARAAIDNFEALDRKAQELLASEVKHTFNSQKAKSLKTALHACIDGVYQAYADQEPNRNVSYLMDEVLEVTQTYRPGCCFFKDKECQEFISTIEAQDKPGGWCARRQPN